MALMLASTAFVMWAPTDNNVTQLIAGDNIILNPENGYGTVTINSTGVGNGELGDNNVVQIVAGDNIVIHPENGYGAVTITARLENEIVNELVAGENIILSGATGTVTISAAGYDATDLNVVQLVAGENITISPENGYGTVTITAAGADQVVNQIIAGTNITISPVEGTGTVTINSRIENNVTRIIAGENITLSPENGYGDVTVTANVIIDNIRPSQLIDSPSEGQDDYFPQYDEGSDAFNWVSLNYGWEKAADVILPGNVSSITFPNLSMETEGPYMLICLDKNVTGDGVRSLFYNGDTTQTNYYTQFITIDGISVSSQRTNTAYIQAGDGISNATTFYWFMLGKIDGGYPFATSQAFRLKVPSSVTVQQYYHIRDNTEDVTSITIASRDSGDLAAGSRWILLRVK